MCELTYLTLREPNFLQYTWVSVSSPIREFYGLRNRVRVDFQKNRQVGGSFDLFALKITGGKSMAFYFVLNQFHGQVIIFTYQLFTHNMIFSKSDGCITENKLLVQARILHVSRIDYILLYKVKKKKCFSFVRNDYCHFFLHFFHKHIKCLVRWLYFRRQF